VASGGLLVHTNNIPISGKEFGILKEGKYFFFEKNKL